MTLCTYLILCCGKLTNSYNHQLPAELVSSCVYLLLVQHHNSTIVFCMSDCEGVCIVKWCFSVTILCAFHCLGFLLTVYTVRILGRQAINPLRTTVRNYVSNMLRQIQRRDAPLVVNRLQC